MCGGAGPAGVEDLARTRCFEHASKDTLGGYAIHVRPTEIACRAHKQGHELDVVVTESSSYAADEITAIGEAKATNTPMDLPHLERLEHLRSLLPSTKINGLPKLLLFARSGFTPPLADLAARRADIELIDLQRLYHGDWMTDRVSWRGGGDVVVDNELVGWLERTVWSVKGV